MRGGRCDFKRNKSRRGCTLLQQQPAHHSLVAGYIGGIVSQMLVEAGHRVTVFDNLSKGHRSAVPEAARFHFGDLGHPDDLDEAMRVIRPDAVFHFAKYAEFEASISIEDGEILAGKLPRKQLRLVQAWIELRHDELLADWELSLSGEQPYKITPL